MSERDYWTVVEGRGTYFEKALLKMRMYELLKKQCNLRSKRLFGIKIHAAINIYDEEFFSVHNLVSFYTIMFE